MNIGVRNGHNVLIMERYSLNMEKNIPKVKKEVRNVNVYTELAKYPVFSIEDVKKLTGNEKTAYSQMDRLMKKGLVKKIRKNIYSVVNPTTGQVVATRYQIACAITDTAYISHHSAFEYYGLANQVYYEVYVSSENKFNHFEYDNVTYKYVASRMQDGVVEAKNTTGVRMTDLERTVVDSIRDFNKIGGFEELLNCLEGIHYLDEKKLKHYLSIYDTQGLYQRVGYLLDHYRKEMQLSTEFIDYCKSKIGKSRRYLVSDLKEESYYNNEWELMVPEGLFEINQGGDILV
jgi:predicted transcriptional regulator of viral defense system